MQRYVVLRSILRLTFVSHFFPSKLSQGFVLSIHHETLLHASQLLSFKSNKLHLC